MIEFKQMNAGAGPRVAPEESVSDVTLRLAALGTEQKFKNVFIFGGRCLKLLFYFCLKGRHTFVRPILSQIFLFLTLPLKSFFFLEISVITGMTIILILFLKISAGQKIKMF